MKPTKGLDACYDITAWNVSSTWHTYILYIWQFFTVAEACLSNSTSIHWILSSHTPPSIKWVQSNKESCTVLPVQNRLPQFTKKHLIIKFCKLRLCKPMDEHFHKINISIVDGALRKECKKNQFTCKKEN